MCSINSTISFVLKEHLSHSFAGFDLGSACLRLLEFAIIIFVSIVSDDLMMGLARVVWTEQCMCVIRLLIVVSFN